MTSQTTSGPQAAIRRFVAASVARVSPDATLAEVAEKLAAVEVGALVVASTATGVDGMISERDLVRAVGSGKDAATTKAGDVAARELIWCAPTDTVEDVARQMMTAYVRHVLVREGDELIGIVSARDVLGAYL
ncbi:MAG: CBS domain-containing protein [Acidimicrobiia bacterium]|nr:CBS domain-containing protein [Acidimicrobiia bacterium]